MKPTFVLKALAHSQECSPQTHTIPLENWLWYVAFT